MVSVRGWPRRGAEQSFREEEKLTNLSFPQKWESSNYKQLWIPDQVGNDKTTEIRASK